MIIPRFIRSCKSYTNNSLRRDSSNNDTPSASAPWTPNFDVLPYLREFSVRISRVLRNNGVKVGYKPWAVLLTCFPRPKDSLACSAKELFTRSAALIATSSVYLETRLNEHRTAVRDPKVAQQANQFAHSIDFDHVTTVDKATRQ